jgi:two-component sensor histidine kinase
MTENMVRPRSGYLGISSERLWLYVITSEDMVECLRAEDIMEKTTMEAASACGAGASSNARNMLSNDFLQELHHRIKNNLQIVCSLLRIQGRGLRDDDAQQTFRRMEERIHSMALVYDKLSESGGHDSVQLDEYLKDVATQLLCGVRRSQDRPRLEFNLKPFVVPSVVATRFGLLLNEILSNHLRHRSLEPRVDLELSLEVVADRARLSLLERGDVRSSVVSEPGERDKQVLAAMVAQIKGEINQGETGEIGTAVRFPAGVLTSP